MVLAVWLPLAQAIGNDNKNTTTTTGTPAGSHTGAKLASDDQELMVSACAGQKWSS